MNGWMDEEYIRWRAYIAFGPLRPAPLRQHPGWDSHSQGQTSLRHHHGCSTFHPEQQALLAEVSEPRALESTGLVWWGVGWKALSLQL